LPKAKEYSGSIASLERKDEISEFFIFPNPIRGSNATARFRILSNAKSAGLDIFDIAGHKVYTRHFSDVKLTNQEALSNLKLGSDIYSARLTVWFESGVKKEKWMKIGVVKSNK
jgi:hypothetical protein